MTNFDLFFGIILLSWIGFTILLSKQNIMYLFLIFIAILHAVVSNKLIRVEKNTEDVITIHFWKKFKKITLFVTVITIIFVTISLIIRIKSDMLGVPQITGHP